MTGRKALFLDRDGVINEDKHYVHRIEDFRFLDGIFDTLHIAQSLGYLLIIITNQAGIGRGYYTTADFHVLNDWMMERFSERNISIDRVYYSPYHPIHGIGTYKKDTLCRKPAPGMILQAQEDFGIDLKRSILIGNMETDIEAGRRAGVGRTILLRMTREYALEHAPATKADHIIAQLTQSIVYL